MDKRAGTAEIVLGAVVTCVIIGACLAYLKLYNKKEHDAQMQVAVNESVANYFQLAQSDDMSTQNTLRSNLNQ